MLRCPMAAALLGLTALLLLPAAFAQAGDEGDGCTSSDPCSIEVIVDEDGIDSVSITAVTSGDWFTLYVSNLEERTHTVTFAGATVQVGDLAEAESQPFQAGSPGTHKLHDEPTGDEVGIEVLEGDVVDAEDGGTDGAASGGEGTPALALASLAVSLLVAVAARRG